MKSTGEILYYSYNSENLDDEILFSKGQLNSREVLKKHLEKKGYRLLSESRDDDKNSRVTCYWIIASGKDYYVYMTSVISEGKIIVVAEAAGEKSDFERYSEIINNAVSTIKIR